MSNEEDRFTKAFHEVLWAHPGKPPGPTAINRMLGKPPPHNILNGRMSTLRRKLLLENGFTQEKKWMRWY